MIIQQLNYSSFSGPIQLKFNITNNQKTTWWRDGEILEVVSHGIHLYQKEFILFEYKDLK